MHVGTQNLSGDNWDAYEVLPQLGVNHVSSNPPRRMAGLGCRCSIAV